MNSKKQGGKAVHSASQAMNLVLKAEQEAEQSIAGCVKTARQTIEEAQQKAARITRRTNKRISMSHLRSKQVIARCVAEMERAASNELLQAHTEGIDKERLAVAVEEVAAMLVGVNSESKNGK